MADSPIMFGKTEPIYNKNDLKNSVVIVTLMAITKLTGTTTIRKTTKTLTLTNNQVPCNPDGGLRLNSGWLMLLPQSTYLPERVPDCYPSLR